MNTKKTLGVIGGMGPLATAYLAQLLALCADVKTDQEHINLLIHEYPSTPDRTAFITGRSPDSPLPFILKAGRQLCDLGADLIAIPCVTSHYFYNEISDALSVPVQSMLEAVADELKRSHVSSAGIMATTGTVTTGLFQKTLAKSGIRAVLCDEADQSRVMSIIYDDVKAGKPINRPSFDLVCEHLKSGGAEKIILGCTELSVINMSADRPADTVDALECLARACLFRLGVKLK